MAQESIQTTTPELQILQYGFSNPVEKSANVLEQQKMYEAIMYTYKNLIPELKDTAKKVAEVRNEPGYSELVKASPAEIVTAIVEARLRDINKEHSNAQISEINYTEKALLFTLAKISYKLRNFTKTIECLDKIGVYISGSFRDLRLAAHKALSSEQLLQLKNNRIQLEIQKAQEEFEQDFIKATTDFTDAPTD